jgi:mono/diheme cytochrome c family protein
VRQRTLAMGVVALAAIGWTGLTLAAVRSTPRTAAIDVTLQPGPEAWQHLTPVELAGAAAFKSEACGSCHTGATGLGPELVTRTKNRTTEWLIAHFRNPKAGSPMQNVSLSSMQMTSLAAFLQKLTPEMAKSLDEAPAFALDGATLYQKHQCGVCHQVNGVGQKLGPVLNGLSTRRSREWIEEHFIEPQKLSPGTTMPAYRFSSREMDRITSYLLSIP